MSRSLAELFADGAIVHPDHRRPNLVHLVRAIGSLSGAPDLNSLPATAELMNLIQPAEHLIFVLLDGLGMNLIRRLPPGNFLARHTVCEIQATVPSTTASALTSIATGQWSTQHAVSGWFMYLPEHGLTAVTLPFSERFTHQPLTQRGITAADVLPVPAFYPTLTARSLTLLPAPIINTTYATWSRGYTPGTGYRSIPHAVDEITAFIKDSPQPTHTHWYIPDVDTMCHKLGTGHEGVLDLVNRIADEVARLAAQLAGRARIIVSADHGLVDVPREHQAGLLDGDPLLQLLQAPPSGDARLPIFHVKPGCHAPFVELFNKRFSDRMVLLPTGEAEQMELFGPGTMSPIARARFGDYVGIAYRPVSLAYLPPRHNPHSAYVALHAGLSPQEMSIPLILA